jgi:hypothetical protein
MTFSNGRIASAADCGPISKIRGTLLPCQDAQLALKGSNFITTFSLRTEEDKSKWTLRRVALLCSID